MSPYVNIYVYMQMHTFHACTCRSICVYTDIHTYIHTCMYTRKTMVWVFIHLFENRCRDLVCGRPQQSLIGRLSGEMFCRAAPKQL